jgi:GNAT superfamily N-acetyltransferase
LKEFTIRKVTDNDLGEMIRLMVEYIEFYQHPVPSASRLNELIRTLLKGEQGVQFIAEHNGRGVGFATLYYMFSTLRAQKVTEMNDLYVMEAFRGTSAAAQLFEACYEFSKNQAFGFMAWKTAGDNKRAQRFYEKMGGQPGDWIRYSKNC